jgi:hypothetical protein
MDAECVCFGPSTVVDDDEKRKTRAWLWLYLFSNLTTIKYELLKVNSRLLLLPSNWSISQRPVQTESEAQHRNASGDESCFSPDKHE